MTTQVVHFHITGEFITQHARNLWGEHEFEKALNLMECIDGLSLDDQYAVLTGKKRLVGTDNLELEDEKKPINKADNGTKLMTLQESYRYQRMCSIVDKLRFRVARNLDERMVASPEGLIPECEFALDSAEEALRRWGESDIEEIQKICMESYPNAIFTESMYKRLHAIRGWGSIGRRGMNNRINLEREDDGEDKIKQRFCTSLVSNMGLSEKDAASAVDVIMGDSSYSPEPVEHEVAMKAEHGWLDRQGQLYECGYMGHRPLADEILPEHGDASRELENRGWAKLSKRRWITFHIRKITKKQKDFILEWCSENGTKLPMELEEFNDED